MPLSKAEKVVYVIIAILFLSSGALGIFKGGNFLLSIAYTYTTLITAMLLILGAFSKD